MFQFRKVEILFISLFALVGWITFLFVDVFFQSQITPIYTAPSHFSAVEENSNSYQQFHQTIKQIEQSSLHEEARVDDFGVQERILENNIQEAIYDELNMDKSAVMNTDIDDIKTNNNARIFEDIQVLETIYRQERNPLILNVLIEKLSQDYQFYKAKEYADTMVASSWLQSIDPHLYIQISLNSSQISVMKASSIEKIKTIVEEARIRWLLSTDDYRFYQSLFLLWYRDYAGAQRLLKQINTPRYTNFIKQQNYIFEQVAQRQDMPKYYQDALVSLNLLKHWYFSISKKTALDVLKQDDSYILPYQILAYSHFLTNNWDTAVEYLFKLVDFDPQNESLYTFLLWISYYWMDKPEQSIIHLSQIEKAVLENKGIGFDPRDLLADSYRYLLLNYQEMDDKERMISTRKKLLWQKKLGKSDFYLFFYENLFRPYIEWRNYELYTMDPMLSRDYVEKCSEALIEREEDICIYGNAGLLFLMNDFEEAKSKLLYLAKNYPQSYIFHTLGDYYFQANDLWKSKQYYIKAISMPHNDYEETILKNKLTDFATQF